jgi:diguanylate cyclase (GGDEF)-like protein
MIDIDNFKNINDSFGHLSGDIVLNKLAELFGNSIRCVDLIFRYGGEEFTILLPETSKGEAKNSAERLREFIEETQFNVLENKKATLTISVGIAEFSEDAKDKQGFIHCADQALFEAKRLGKNRVCVWEEDLPLRAENA